MARKSRSKQNKSGKKSSSKSSSSGGGGGGGGKSGGGKSGGGKSGGSKNKRGSGNKSKQSQNKSTSTKSTSTKSTSTKSTGNARGSGQAGKGTVGGGQKTNPTKKTTTVSTKTTTTQTKSPTKTVSTKTKQGKDRTPAQIAAATRIAESKTISDVKAANDQKMRDAARIRDQKFKQTGVQTLGGKKTSFTKAEQLKIQQAGYTVDGYSTAAARSDADVDAFRAAAKAKADAEAAAKAAAEKKAADEKLARQFDPTRLYAGTEYDNYVASLPEGVRNDMMIGGQTRSPLSEAAIAAGTILGGKALIGGGLSALGIGGSKGLGFKGVQAGFTGMGKKGFDAIRGGANYIASKKPQILGRGAYSAPTFKGAQRYAGTQGSLGGTQTPGGVIKSIVPGKASRIGFIESQAKVPSATFDKGVQLANKLSAGNYGSSSLANTLRSQMVSGVAPGGGIGSNLGNIAKQTGVATAVAGGLNIGSTGGVDSGEASAKPSGVARVIAGGADKVMRDTTDFDRRGKEKNFLADAFVQTNTALKTIKPYFDAAKGQDDKSIRKQASNLLTDIGSKEELAPVARGIKAFTTDNPNVPNKFGMETLSDIRDTFTPGKPKIPSIDPKSGIVGAIGNRMLAGDIKNIVKEADQQTGVEKGATRTLGQTINVAKQIGKNLGDTSTQGYKSGQKIAKLVGTGSGKPTPGSILSGVNPFRRRTGGGSTPAFTPSSAPSFTPSGRSGGGGTPVGQVPQVPPTTQFQVPEIPQQQGLDAGNLANIQNESYQNTFKNLMAINPNYSARFQMRRRRRGGRRSFAKAFSRRFFS